MLELKNITKVFNAGTVNEKVALKNLNLTLHDGDFVTVIGGNGAGKSTMLNAIAGVWPVDEGRILLDGNDVTPLPEHQRAWLILQVGDDLRQILAQTVLAVLEGLLREERDHVDTHPSHLLRNDGQARLRIAFLSAEHGGILRPIATGGL